ncbi:MAG: pitrilysin family protein [Candidatus Omnitrophota bacterium]
MYKKITLDNGSRLVLNHMPNMESASLGIWLKTGSRNEEKKISGISHFLEHMIFKGSPSRNSRKIKEEIEGRGGSLNGFTSEEITCYLVKVSSRHVDIAMDVLSDMVLNASLDKKEIEKERTVIIEEIKMYKDLPGHLVHDALYELMWPGHSLGRNIAGSIQTVSSISREDIASYKRKNYIPKNTAIVLCGNLKKDHVIKKAKGLLSFENALLPQAIAEFKSPQSSPCIKIAPKRTAQTHMCLGLRSSGRFHKDRYAMSLLHILLGANMSSRLFENIREKRGLAYEIYTEVKRYDETGSFIINAGMEHKKAEEVLRLALKELKNIKDHIVPAKELKRAKEFFKVQTLLSLEDTMDHMLWLGEKVIMKDSLPDKDRIIKNIDRVSSQDLQRVAKDVFKDEGLNLAVVGPVKDKEKNNLERLLHI